MTNRKKLNKKGLFFLVGSTVLVIILIFVSVNLCFHFDPLRKRPDEIVVYKYGTTYTLTPADEAFQVLYHQLRGAWEVKWNEQLALDSYADNYLLGYAEYFFDSGLAVQVKYDQTQTTKGAKTVGSKYDSLIFILDTPKQLPSDISEIDRNAIMDLPFVENEYPVYYKNKNEQYGTAETYRYASPGSKRLHSSKL